MEDHAYDDVLDEFFEHLDSFVEEVPIKESVRYLCRIDGCRKDFCNRQNRFKHENQYCKFRDMSKRSINDNATTTAKKQKVNTAVSKLKSIKEAIVTILLQTSTDDEKATKVTNLIVKDSFVLENFDEMTSKIVLCLSVCLCT
jgi:hypothetical protein